MLRIVIVEDEDIIRRGMVYTINWEKMGAVICGIAADGIEGLKVIQEQKPDIVLTDIRMPRMDGLEMSEKLREEGMDLRLVFLTSYAEFDYAQQALRLNAYDYLLKPIDEAELEKMLNKINQEMAESEQGNKSDIPQLADWETLLANQQMNPYVRKTLVYIQENYKEKISIEAMADSLEVSSSYLSRKLKKCTGKTFGELLATYRLQKALELLFEGTYRVYEIAEETGFGEYKTFCQTFKKYLEVSPKKFMQDREMTILGVDTEE